MLRLRIRSFHPTIQSTPQQSEDWLVGLLFLIGDLTGLGSWVAQDHFSLGYWACQSQCNFLSRLRFIMLDWLRLSSKTTLLFIIPSFS